MINIITLICLFYSINHPLIWVYFLLVHGHEKRSIEPLEKENRFEVLVLTKIEWSTYQQSLIFSYSLYEVFTL